MRHLFLSIFLFFVCTVGVFAQFADPAVSGANFVPNEVSVGQKAVLSISFANSGSTPIPTNSIELTISTAKDYYKSDGTSAPGGAGGALFTWTYVGADVWRGTNSSTIPAFGGGIITLSVSGIAISPTFETTNVNVQPVANFGAFNNAATNDNLQPKLRVIAASSLPIAVNDNATTPNNTAVTIPVLTNDNLNGGTNPVVSVVTPSPNGTATFSGNQIVFTPTTGFSGTTTLTYKITASNGVSNTATVTIIVDAPVVAPVAVNDNATTPSNTAVTIPVLTNDNLNGGTNPVVSVVTPSPNGTATISGNQIVFTPTTGFSGTTTLTYKITASNGVSNTATVTITVNAPACNIAINITNKTCNNNGTPSNPNDDTYSFTLTVTGGTGNWSGSYNNPYLGLFQFAATPYNTPIQLGPFPAGSFISNNTNPPITVPSIDISIEVQDVQNSNCYKSMVVTSTGTCSNVVIPPVAANDNSTTPQNTAVTIPVLTNDNLNGGTNPVVSIVTPSPNGTATVSGNQVIFTPATGFSGTTTLTYKITASNGVSNTATVTITVQPPTATGSIGDLTFNDNNGNGVYDTGDTPKSNILVTLCNSAGQTITTTLSVSGNYSFSGLTAGTYIVKFAPVHTDGKVLTTPQQVTVNLASGENYTSADAGYKTPNTPSKGSIGDFIYCDNNNNSNYDAGDTPQSGVLITLCTSTYQTITTTTSDANGFYTFSNLAAGTYIVKFPLTLADGKKLTKYDYLVNLTAGENVKWADAGYYKPTTTQYGSIGDLTYCDNNNNRIYDNGDTPASGVQVQLCNTSNVVIATATTNAQGKYLFSNLVAATYIVKFPASIAGGKTITTTNPITINLGSGQNYLDADAGYCVPSNGNGSIGDFIYCDNNNNSNYDAGDTPQSGVLITLCTSTYQTITTTTSDANGYYKFSNLAAGTYIVKFPLTLADGKKLTKYDYLVNLTAGENVQWADAGYYKPATTCNINFDINKCYKIVNRSNGYVLDVEGGGCEENTPIATWAYNGESNQQWRIESLGNGYFKLMSRNCGMFMGTHNTGAGEIIMQFNYYAGGAKDWKITCTPDGYYQLTHKLSTLILDADCSHEGCPATINNADGSGSQQWKIIEVSCNTASDYLASGEKLLLDVRNEINQTRINWVNNTGHLIDYFSVQRMNNATGKFEDLKTLNPVAGLGDIKTYTDFDTNPQEGDNYYRIKATYLNGTEKFTEPKKVSFAALGQFKVFPNPAMDILNIDLQQYMGRDVTIYMYNALGNQVLYKNIDKAEKATVQLDISAQTSGSYLVRVTSVGKRDVTKKVNIAH